ncbi:ORF1A [Serpentovirinae sp. isolate L25]|nr:ORF1A [Serpentovirinae sp.]QFU19806.1 ORF1A [Serpentovirinae sp.]
MVVSKVYQKGTKPIQKVFTLKDQKPLLNDREKHYTKLTSDTASSVYMIPSVTNRDMPHESSAVSTESPVLLPLIETGTNTGLRATKPFTFNKITLGDYETIKTIPSYYCMNPRKLETSKFYEFSKDFTKTTVFKHHNREAYLYIKSFIEKTDATNKINPVPMKVDSDIFNQAPYTFSTVSTNKCMSFVIKCLDYIFASYGITSYLSNFNITNLSGLMAVLPKNLTLVETYESCSDLTILYQENVTDDGTTAHVGLYHNGHVISSQPITHVTRKFTVCFNTTKTVEDELFYQTKSKEVKVELSKFAYHSESKGVSQFLLNAPPTDPCTTHHMEFKELDPKELTKEYVNATTKDVRTTIKTLTTELNQREEHRVYWPVDPTQGSSRAIENKITEAAVNKAGVAITIDQSQIPNCTLTYTNKGYNSWGQPNRLVQGYENLTTNCHSGECLKKVLNKCCLKCYEDIKNYMFDTSKGPIDLSSHFAYNYLQHIIMLKAWCPDCEQKLVNFMAKCTCPPARHNIRQGFNKWQQLYQLKPTADQYGTDLCGTHYFETTPNTNYTNVEVPFIGKSLPRPLNFHHTHGNITKTDVHEIYVREKNGRHIPFMDTPCYGNGNEWNTVRPKRQNRRQVRPLAQQPQPTVQTHDGATWKQSTVKHDTQDYAVYLEQAKENPRAFAFPVKKDKTGAKRNFDENLDYFNGVDVVEINEHIELPELNKPTNCQEAHTELIKAGLVKVHFNTNPYNTTIYPTIPTAYYICRENKHFSCWNPSTGRDVCTNQWSEFKPITTVNAFYTFPEYYTLLQLYMDIPKQYPIQMDISQIIEDTQAIVDDIIGCGYEDCDESEMGTEDEEDIEDITEQMEALEMEDEEWTAPTKAQEWSVPNTITPIQTTTTTQAQLTASVDVELPCFNTVQDFITYATKVFTKVSPTATYAQFLLPSIEGFVNDFARTGYPFLNMSSILENFKILPTTLKTTIVVPLYNLASVCNSAEWSQYLAHHYPHLTIIKPTIDQAHCQAAINKFNDVAIKHNGTDSSFIDYTFEKSLQLPTIEVEATLNQSPKPPKHNKQRAQANWNILRIAVVNAIKARQITQICTNMQIAFEKQQQARYHWSIISSAINKAARSNFVTKVCLKMIQTYNNRINANIAWQRIRARLYIVALFKQAGKDHADRTDTEQNISFGVETILAQLPPSSTAQLLPSPKQLPPSPKPRTMKPQNTTPLEAPIPKPRTTPPKRPPMSWTMVCKNMDLDLSQYHQAKNHSNYLVGPTIICRLEGIDKDWTQVKESLIHPDFINIYETDYHTFIELAFPEHLNFDEDCITEKSVIDGRGGQEPAYKWFANYLDWTRESECRPAKFDATLCFYDTLAQPPTIINYDMRCLNHGHEDTFVQDVYNSFNLMKPILTNTEYDWLNLIQGLFSSANYDLTFSYDGKRLKEFIILLFAHENGITDIEKLARGAYGTTYKAMYNNQQVVFKVQLEFEAYYNEVCVANHLAAKDIKVRTPQLLLHGMVPSLTNCYFLVFEYVNGHTIDQIIDKGYIEQLDTQQKLHLFFEYIEMVELLNQHTIDHNDTHCSNVMVDDKFKVWIIDFGCSVNVGEDTKRFNTAFAYNILLGMFYPDVVDVSIVALANELVDYNAIDVMFHPQFQEFHEEFKQYTGLFTPLECLLAEFDLVKKVRVQKRKRPEVKSSESLKTYQANPCHIQETIVLPIIESDEIPPSYSPIKTLTPIPSPPLKKFKPTQLGYYCNNTEYEEMEYMAKGTSATCYTDGHLVAKLFDCNASENHATFQEWYNAEKIGIYGPKYVDCFSTKKYLCIIMTMATGTPIIKIPAKKFTKQDFNAFAVFMRNCMTCFEANSLYHLDLNGNNLLYDINTKLFSLIDYGLCGDHSLRHISLAGFLCVQQYILNCREIPYLSAVALCTLVATYKDIFTFLKSLLGRNLFPIDCQESIRDPLVQASEYIIAINKFAEFDTLGPKMIQLLTERYTTKQKFSLIFQTKQMCGNTATLLKLFNIKCIKTTRNLGVGPVNMIPTKIGDFTEDDLLALHNLVIQASPVTVKFQRSPDTNIANTYTLKEVWCRMPHYHNKLPKEKFFKHTYVFGADLDITQLQFTGAYPNITGRINNVKLQINCPPSQWTDCDVDNFVLEVEQLLSYAPLKLQTGKKPMDTALFKTLALSRKPYKATPFNNCCFVLACEPILNDANLYFTAEIIATLASAYKSVQGCAMEFLQATLPTSVMHYYCGEHAQASTTQYNPCCDKCLIVGQPDYLQVRGCEQQIKPVSTINGTINYTPFAYLSYSGDGSHGHWKSYIVHNSHYLCYDSGSKTKVNSLPIHNIVYTVYKLIEAPIVISDKIIPGIKVVLGDITTTKGTIVNSTGVNYTPGGGVDGAIFKNASDNYRKFHLHCNELCKSGKLNTNTPCLATNTSSPTLTADQVWLATVDCQFYQQSLTARLEYMLSRTPSLIIPPLGCGIYGQSLDDFLSVVAAFVQYDITIMTNDEKHFEYISQQLGYTQLASVNSELYAACNKGGKNRPKRANPDLRKLAGQIIAGMYGNVVDLGIGHGGDVIAYKTNKAITSVLGVDNCQEALNECNTRAKVNEVGKITTIQLDLTTKASSLWAQEQNCDVYFSNCAYHYFDQLLPNTLNQIHIVPFYNSEAYHTFSDYYNVEVIEKDHNSITHRLTSENLKCMEKLYTISYWIAKFPNAEIDTCATLLKKGIDHFTSNYLYINNCFSESDVSGTETEGTTSEAEQSDAPTMDSIDLLLHEDEKEFAELSTNAPPPSHTESNFSDVTDSVLSSESESDKYVVIHGDVSYAVNVHLTALGYLIEQSDEPVIYCMEPECKECSVKVTDNNVNHLFPSDILHEFEPDKHTVQIYLTPDADTMREFSDLDFPKDSFVTTKVDALSLKHPVIIVAADSKYAAIMYNVLRRRGCEKMVLYRHIVKGYPTTTEFVYTKCFKTVDITSFVDSLRTKVMYVHYKSTVETVEYYNTLDEAIANFLTVNNIPYTIKYHKMYNHVFINPSYNTPPANYAQILDHVKPNTGGHIGIKTCVLSNGHTNQIVYTADYVGIYENDVLIHAANTMDDTTIVNYLEKHYEANVVSLDLVGFYGDTKSNNYSIIYALLLTSMFLFTPWYYVLFACAFIGLLVMGFRLRFGISVSCCKLYCHLRNNAIQTLVPHLKYNYNTLCYGFDTACTLLTTLIAILWIRSAHYDNTIIYTNKPAFHTMSQRMASFFHLIPTLEQYTKALTLKSVCSGVLCSWGRPYNHHFLSDYTHYVGVAPTSSVISVLKTILSYTPITIWFKHLDLEFWQLILLNSIFLGMFWFFQVNSRPCCKPTGPYCSRHANIARTTWSYCVEGKQFYFQTTRNHFCNQHNWWCDHNGSHILPKPIAVVIQSAYNMLPNSIKGDSYYDFVNVASDVKLPSIGKEYHPDRVYTVEGMSYHTWSHIAAYHAYVTGRKVQIATVDINDCVTDAVSCTHNFKLFLLTIMPQEWIKYIEAIPISDRNVLHVNLFTSLTTKLQSTIKAYVSQNGSDLAFTNIEYDTIYDGIIPSNFDVAGPSLKFHTPIINLDTYGNMVLDQVRHAAKQAKFRIYHSHQYRRYTITPLYYKLAAAGALLAVILTIIFSSPAIKYSKYFGGLNPSGKSCKVCPLYYQDQVEGVPVSLAAGNPNQAYQQYNGTYAFTRKIVTPTKTECTLPKYHMYQPSIQLDCGGTFPTIIDIGVMQIMFMLQDSIYYTPVGVYNIQDPTTCITLFGQTHCHITPMQLTPTRFAIYLTLLLFALIAILWFYMKMLKIFGIYTYDIVQLLLLHCATITAYWFSPAFVVITIVISSFFLTIKPFIYYGYIFFVASFICGCPIFVIILYFVIFITYHYWQYMAANTGVSVGMDGVVFSSNFDLIAKSTFFIKPGDLYKVSLATNKSIADIVQLAKQNTAKPTASLAYHLCKAHTENRIILFQGTSAVVPVFLQSILMRVSDIVIPQATQNLATFVLDGEVVGHGIFITPTTVLTARHVPTVGCSIAYHGNVLPILSTTEVGFNMQCTTTHQSVSTIKIKKFEYKYNNNLTHFTSANGIRCHQIYMSPSGHIPFANTFPGESGSPIFEGDTLVGIHQGIVNQGGIHGIITDPYGVAYDSQFHDIHGTVGKVQLSSNRHYESFFSKEKKPIDIATFRTQLEEVKNLYDSKPLFDTFDPSKYTGVDSIDLSSLITYLKGHNVIENLTLPSLQRYVSSKWFNITFTNIFSLWLAITYILKFTFSIDGDAYDMVTALILGAMITSVFRYRNALFTITSASYIINKLYIFYYGYLFSLLAGDVVDIHLNLYDTVLLFFIFAFVVYKAYNAPIQTAIVVVGSCCYSFAFGFDVNVLAYTTYIIIAPASLYTAFSIFMLTTPFSYYWICINVVLSLRLVYPKSLRHFYANLTGDTLYVPHQFLASHIALTNTYPNYFQCFLATLFYDNEDVVKFRPQSANFYINAILGLSTKTNNVERKSAAMMNDDESTKLAFLLEAIEQVCKSELQSQDFLSWVTTVTEVEQLYQYIQQHKDMEDKQSKKNCNIAQSRIDYLNAQEKKFLKQIDAMHQEEVRALVRTENLLKLSGLLKTAVDRLMERSDFVYKKFGAGIVAASTMKSKDVLAIINKDVDISVVFGDDNVICMNNDTKQWVFATLKNNAGDLIENETAYANLKPSDYPLIAQLITPTTSLQANVGYTCNDADIKVTNESIWYKNREIFQITDKPSDIELSTVNGPMFLKIKSNVPPSIMLAMFEKVRSAKAELQAIRIGGIDNSPEHLALSTIPLRTEGYITYLGESVCRECTLDVVHTCEYKLKFVQIPQEYASNPMAYVSTHKACPHNKYNHQCTKPVTLQRHHNAANAVKLTAAEKYLMLKQQLKN